MHRVTLEQRAGVAIVTVSGEVDAFVAPELEEAFGTASDASLVVADLGRVSFLDSTALGVIVRATQSRSESQAMRVVLPTGAARRIFEITTLDRALPLAATREEALAEL
jgi:anti-anti-sigma factor